MGPTGITSRVSPGESPIQVVPAKATAVLVAIPNAHADPRRDFVEWGEIEERRGKEFRLLVPMRVQDVTNEYTFTFLLREVEIVTYKCPASVGCDLTLAKQLYRRSRRQGETPAKE